MARRFALCITAMLLALLVPLALAQNDNYTDEQQHQQPQEEPRATSRPYNATQARPNATQPTRPQPAAPNATRPVTRPQPAAPNATRPAQAQPTAQGNATQTQQANATQPAAPSDQNATSGDDATAFLPITLSNNNSWVTGRFSFEQNNYLMQNTADRPICDVTFKTPLINGSSTRVSSIYNADIRNTTSDAIVGWIGSLRPAQPGKARSRSQTPHKLPHTQHFELPFYIQTILPGQTVSFGWILRSMANGTATGGMVNLTSARFCENNDYDNNGQHRLRRRVLVQSNRWA